MKSRFTGCLLGLALGDALGAPFEGMPPGQHPYSCNASLIYTDDTEMMINLAEGITSSGAVDPEEIAGSFVRGLSPCRGYGPGTLRVLSLIRSGTPFDEAAKTVFPDGSFGNGAAMRVAPVGLLYWWDKDRLLEAAAKASIPTHIHPLGIEGARVMAYAVGLILRGTGREEIPGALLEVTKETLFSEKILKMRELLSADAVEEEVILHLGNGVLAQDSVPTALYAFLKFGDTYEEMVKFCLSLGGDTDTIAAMAGSLSGAYITEGGLPEECIQRLEGASRIRSMAERLFELSETLKKGKT